MVWLSKRAKTSVIRIQMIKTNRIITNWNSARLTLYHLYMILVSGYHESLSKNSKTYNTIDIFDIYLFYCLIDAVLWIDQ